MVQFFAGLIVGTLAFPSVLIALELHERRKAARARDQWRRSTLTEGQPS